MRSISEEEQMLTSMQDFIDYFGGIRRRTLNYIRVVPGDRLDWSPTAGEYTCGDIMRHLMAAEQMYVHLIRAGEWRYPGHTAHAGESLDALIARMDAAHKAAMEVLRSISDGELAATRPSFLPDSPPVKVWRWLMAMVEHEVHHRSQLASYLTLMGCQPPQIFGVGVEDLIARSLG
jgi:uncharacterized damage-inducible protein DinB